MLEPLLSAIRADIARKLHEINGARIERGVCIRQDARLMRLSDEAIDDFIRLARLDPEQSAKYHQCAELLIRFRRSQPARLRQVA